MRILISNDDGIHGAGLKLLEAITGEFSDDVWVVAPETDQSGVSHSFSLSTPLRLREISPRHFAVQGTPTDCVLMACKRLLGDKPPDLVLSGVNRGQNVAEDVAYSGTIAAALEATLLGVPAIALSQAYGGLETRERQSFAPAQVHAPGVIRQILATGIAPGTLINVNFPPCQAEEVTGVVVTSQGRRSPDLVRIEQRRDGRHIPYYWLMFQRAEFTPGPGTDLEALAARKVSVTPLKIDQTDLAERERFSAAFAKA